MELSQVDDFGVGWTVKEEFNLLAVVVCVQELGYDRAETDGG